MTSVGGNAMRCTWSICRWFVCGLVACCLTTSGAGWAAADTDKDKAKAEMKTDKAHDQMMAEMAKYGAPGPAHEGLKKMEGKWKASMKSWFAPGEPTVSEGTAVNTLVLGGRFVEMRYSADFMGMPFEGIGYTGYDNKKNEYLSFWADNMSTVWMTSTGQMNASKNELSFTGISDGPDGKPMKYRMVTRIVDDNKHVFSMYAPMEGKDQLMMEITYTRM
jgi:hypothetical protein